MSRTKSLEDNLLRLCQEKDELTSEFSKMPQGGGRTAAARERKRQVEARLDAVGKEISATRLQLKKLGAK
jgi:hypothetical protein